MKQAKAVYRYELWCSNYAIGGKYEKSLSDDSEHKPYVRAKRNKNNLPDPWDNTKPLPMFKSWKHRSKCRKQWMKHKVSLNELTILKWLFGGRRHEN